MKIAIVASLCHLVSGAPSCHPVTVLETDGPMHICNVAQLEITEWKSRSMYRFDEWTVGSYQCVLGTPPAKTLEPAR